MRYNVGHATTDWVFLEVIDHRGKRPCSDAYADANVEELANVFAELRLLRAAGVPPNRLLGSPEVELIKHKCKGDHKKTSLYALKAKPSGWRLYFRVLDPNLRQLEFLYAVHKKKDKRDPEDLDRCCGILGSIGAGRCSRDKLFIPDR
jgi:hypothetical protein